METDQKARNIKWITSGSVLRKQHRGNNYLTVLRYERMISPKGSGIDDSVAEECQRVWALKNEIWIRGEMWEGSL